jgi:DNA-binding beta-propeller fold protein YncE
MRKNMQKEINMKKMKSFIIIFIILILLVLPYEKAFATNLPYDTYNFDYWDYIVFTPAAYVPETNISGLKLGIGAFSNPQDVCVSEDNKVYVADTGKNRVVVLNKSMNEVVEVIDGFNNNGVKDTFNAPSGLYITSNNELYIADTNNQRVVVLDELGKLIYIISNPTSEVLEDGFVFNPLKVSVDYANRVYVVAKNMFQGVMAFDDKGNFTGFSGTLKVQIGFREKIWRKLSTKAQRSKQVLFIPTEFTGIDVDKDGFLYATNIDNMGEQAVRRLNPKGEDIIRKGENKNLGGDVSFGIFGTYAGPSYISDVVVREKGIYSLVDTRRGRVFTYDHEGNLLYVFGGLGSQAGTFRIPVAVEAMGDKILVLDSQRAEILTFVETKYGNLINDAVGLRYDGDEVLAVEKWKEVLKLNSNFELANVGIGKAYLTAGDNKQAMKYLKLGMSKTYYSIALKRYRNEILKENLGYILTGVVVVVGLYQGVKVVKKNLGRRDGENE